ncbi:hypothetical protein Rsub_03831 [Raphidocelis subcapitata]|uniref:Dynamin-related GTPase n=1 Tax=Raphidocelis subcapitata TaxID=307507 RepID=A0A2V0NTL8_9CHLO|nr:hypothetical protein Rsub_03831 [Raphidocelis subcapitata]|eukprot:GBF90976.1 hypothetical protein Rsub_03831 [Raphidocelis subcapitata]
MDAPPESPEVLGDSLIPVINRLQDIFSQVTLDFKLALPQVAVVGSQSSGKSSVLEALVGRDFLPRGPEICTRRPLVLQLVKLPSGGPAPGSAGGAAGAAAAAANGAPPAAGSGTQLGGGAPAAAVAAPSAAAAAAGRQPREWGEFLHAPGKIFTDFERIRQEIQAETDRVSGGGKNISDKPIRLKICSPNVLTMTLIDLPGMTKVPVGDQPSDIERRIREMVFSYIREPTCLILAVSASNTDLANSDALQVAQLVDPEGARTIGVMTKLDIMDRGTSAVSALKNGVVPLRLGYVAVVNRSQADINSRRSMADARRAEAAWFDHHSEYSEVAASCGVGALARRINTLLGAHIRTTLPQLRRQIAEALEARAAELGGYGEELDLGSDSAKSAALLQLLCAYADRYDSLLEGRCEDMSLSELNGGARIRHLFLEVYGRQLRLLDPTRDLGDDEVRTAIKNSSGTGGTLLIPQEPFELLVRRAITKLLAPSLQVKDMVYEELLRIAEGACPRDLPRFPNLQRRLAAAVLEFIQAGADPAERMIRALVECEHDYINTDHPEFIGGTRAIKAVIEEREARRQAGAAHAGGSDSGAGGGVGAGAVGARKGASTDGRAGDHISKAKPSGSLPEGRGGGGAGARALGWEPGAGLKGLHDGGGGGHDDTILVSRTRVGTPRDDSAGGGDGGIFGSASGGAGGAGAKESPLGWFSWLKGDAAGGGGAGGGSRPGGGAADLVEATRAAKPRNEQEEVQVEVIRLLVSSYFDIVRHNLADMVPKCLMRHLVHHSQRGMQQHLIASLYRDELAGELLRERDDVARSRARCKAAVAALQAAAETLESVPSELSASMAAAADGPGGGRPGGGGGGGGGAAAGASVDGGGGDALVAAAAAAAAAHQQSLGAGADVSGVLGLAAAAAPDRRALAGGDRHPSMRAAAQLASAAAQMGGIGAPGSGGGGGAGLAGVVLR